MFGGKQVVVCGYGEVIILENTLVIDEWPLTALCFLQTPDYLSDSLSFAV